MDNKTTTKPLSRSEMWQQLANAIALRSSQDQVLWIIFGTFWAANLLLFNALIIDGKFTSESIVGIFVSIVGIIISRLWNIIQNRGIGHIERHERIIYLIESNLFTKDEIIFANSPDLNKCDFKQYLPKGKSARYLMKICSKLSIIPWGLFIIYFIWILLHCKYNLI